MAGVWVAQFAPTRKLELVGWLPAVLIDADERKCQLDDGRVIQANAADILPRNPAIQDAVDDLTALSYMHEPAVLHNLHRRFDLGAIYTYTGTILIAVNPYAKLPGLYGPDMMAAYCNVPLGKLSPHVYAIAEDAFRSMLRDERSQSILVSGESGAGKTETTKLLLQYFANVSGKGEAAMQAKVLESTPLLEAFGNARTRFNDNSSRFGRFIKIGFSRAGQMRGASVHTYLLEKSRVVRPAQGERNYHIFYQLLAGLPAADKTQLQLTTPESYHYLKQSGCYSVAGVDDAAAFGRTCTALSTVGISAEDQLQIWRVLAAILHIGNVTFSGDEEAVLNEPSPALQQASLLLGLSAAALTPTLIQRRISTGSESITTHNSPIAAEAARDALAMLLYSRLFSWLVARINANLSSSAAAVAADVKYWIGVLDLYGFECFAENSFEQFCINYANEKLQQQFNLHVFKLEQQEYVKEKIDWRMIEFRDNQSTVDMFEKPRSGLLALLDEEARFPKASGETLAAKFKTNHLNKSAAFEGPKFGSNGFAVQHYAGRVEYMTAKFLDKTRDYIISDQLALLARGAPFVASLIPQVTDASPRSSGGGSSSGSSFQFTSVASQFRESLASLMTGIGETAPHFIRCVKPNDQQRPLEFAPARVAEQLRCGGVMEAVRISSAGFPSRLAFRQFFVRYRVLVASLLPRTLREGNDFDYRAACSRILAASNVYVFS